MSYRAIAATRPSCCPLQTSRRVSVARVICEQLRHALVLGISSGVSVSMYIRSAATAFASLLLTIPVSRLSRTGLVRRGTVAREATSAKYIRGRSRCRFLAVWTSLLVGCTGPCTDTHIVGDYEASIGGATYVISLLSGSTGEMREEDIVVGRFSWSFSPLDGLQLRVPRAVGDQLRRLGRQPSVPSGIASFEEEIFLLHPRCGIGGTKIALSPDGGVDLSRIR